MKTKTIALFVTSFIVLHFGAGLFCFWVDISSANYVMAHYYQEVHGYPKGSMCIASAVLWFPAGPLSSFIWAVPFYGALRLVGWAINRRQRQIAHETLA